MGNRALYKVILLLGSNLPLGKMSPEQIIEEADKELIDALLPDYLEVGALEEAVFTTPVIQTEPVGKFEEEKTADGRPVKTPVFSNQILLCLTDKDPMEVLDQIQRIENLFGRMRTYKEKGLVYQSRTLDIDILKVFKTAGADKMADTVADKQAFWTELEIDNERLTIPHPQVESRPFVKELLDMLPR